MTWKNLPLETAQQHLRSGDPVMAAMMDAVGPFALKLEPNRFGMLVRSIISQQISTAAARSIRTRVEQHLAPQKITAAGLLACDLEQLRALGLSAQKASYLLDLAEKTEDGTVKLRSIARLDDEAIIAQLTQVKGIGRWTAQMFLIFALGRLDVFPHDDLGIRSAIRDSYQLNDLPSKQTSLEIAAPWRPFATIATWYCWRSLDVAKKPKDG
ncbi:DNA-3-methyladenine glycosylase family protein [Lignipirellula cremea]|uniref:DNA-3-methyladenine glycosylase II n=1 Tax=Lignipirellula cremea TaxID=2528010 RepID=A0A518DWZ5_9BACT|nr:DNA-3-methyladenine glycosylase [Lignipirellula cremea]QDU96361.1 DNA-3-methyladenine glycosylase [Lignipirellula cremea]